MKRGFLKLMLHAFFFIGMTSLVLGQESDSPDANNSTDQEMVVDSSNLNEKVVRDSATEGPETDESENNDDNESKLTFMQQIKAKFIEGDPVWMTPVLICLIIGLALSIERIIFLNLSTINTSKFLKDVEDALNNGGVQKAKELCRNTRGPIASIFYQGLDRSEEGLEMVEKSVVAYGGVQMGNLEKGLSWLQLFIALSPMLGFLGTVIGMIQAFDVIEKEGGVEPSTVAGGIKVSLLTTVFGLIAAIILQIFYNYVTSKIDGLVNEMEDASISLVDMLLETKTLK